MQTLLEVVRERLAATSTVRLPPAVVLVLALFGLLAVGLSRSTGPIGALALPPAEQPAHPVLLPIVLKPPVVTCAHLDAAWGNDWPRVIYVLDELIERNESCGPEPLASKKYAAHYNYGVVLENGGDIEGAVIQYQAAFQLDPHRREAWAALVRLDRLPPPEPPPCQPADQILTTPYNPPWAGAEPFVSIHEGQLVLAGQPFPIKGVNYYPRSAPWHRFLPQATVPEMSAELDVIAQAGFNTIRVFLWYDALFTCSPEEAVPLAAPFAKVDALLALAHERGLKVIMTLNDLPDLTYRPLYTDWARYDAQTAFIVQRYRNDPTILAWDLRNEGDIDYGVLAPDSARFTRDQVLDWLAHIAPLVKSIDPQHLTTAGWLSNPTVTGPYVDFLSFHHWSGAEYLRNRVHYYRTLSSQPLLVEEVGRHTWSSTPPSPQAEAVQAEFFQPLMAEIQAQGLAGWVVWTAFDFTPPPGQPANYQHYYGLWRTDLSPKPALSVLPLP